MEKNIADKIRKLRLEKGLSQKEVAYLLGLSKNAFTNYELGIREPSLNTLKKICELFDVSADYLLGLEL